MTTMPTTAYCWVILFVHIEYLYCDREELLGGDLSGKNFRTTEG